MAVTALRLGKGSHDFVYVVADDFERALLTEDVRLQFPWLLTQQNDSQPDHGERNMHVSISDYASLCTLLGEKCAFWKKKNVTIVCEVDIHYSAAFASLFPDLFAWSAAPTSDSKLRVVTFSTLDTPEPSLVAVRSRVWPGTMTFSLIELEQPQESTGWIQETFTDDLIADNANETAVILGLGAPVFIIGQADHFHQMVAAMRSRRLENFVCKTNYREEVDSHVERIGIVPNPILVGIIETSRFLSRVVDMTCVIVAETRMAPMLVHGRVVSKPVDVSQREIDEVRYCIYNDNAGDMRATNLKLIVPASTRPDSPPRRLENDQLLGFVAGVVMLSENIDCNAHAMLGCFIQDSGRAMMALQQLEAAKFLGEEPNIRGSPIHIPSDSLGHTFLAVLRRSDFHFDSAWLLANGLESAASNDAKRAMAVMASIMQTGNHIMSTRFSKGAIFVAQVQNDLGSIAQLLGARLPPNVLANGWLWVALACVYYCVQQDCDLGEVVLKYFCSDRNEEHDIEIDASVAKIVIRRAKDLTRTASYRYLFSKHHPLILSAEDVDCAYTAMVNAWAPKCLAVEVLDNDGTQVFVSDLMSIRVRDASLIAHPDDFVYPMYQRGIDAGQGHATARFFIAPLTMSQVQSEHGLAFHYNMSVVLPVAMMKQWRSRHGDNLLQAARRARSLEMSET